MLIPTRKEVEKFCREFIRREYPEGYTFRFVPELMPIRISIEQKKVYVNWHILQETIKKWAERGIDWKSMLTAILQHEKGHIRTKLYEPVNVIAFGEVILGLEPGKVVAVLNAVMDWVIDEIYYKDKPGYREVTLKDYRIAFEEYKRFSYRERMEFFFDIYVVIASHLAEGVATEEEVRMHFPERVEFILRFAELLKGIRSEREITVKTLEGLRLYLEL